MAVSVNSVCSMLMFVILWCISVSFEFNCCSFISVNFTFSAVPSLSFSVGTSEASLSSFSAETSPGKSPV